LLQTFVAIYIVVLDDYRPPIDRRILLGLPAALAHVRRILPSRAGSRISRYS
jgi:hypothetical protein